MKQTKLPQALQLLLCPAELPTTINALDECQSIILAHAPELNNNELAALARVFELTRTLRTLHAEQKPQT